MSIYGFAGGTNEAACLCGCQERIRTLEAEVERLTGIIQETYTSAEEDHRRLFEVLAETERLRAEWKDSDEQFQHVYAQRVDEMNAAEARARKAQARVRELEAALGRTQEFIDWKVREWLPSEHTNCGTDSGCAHGAMEREMFQALDDAVDAICAALTKPTPPAKASHVCDGSMGCQRCRDAEEPTPPAPGGGSEEGGT